ncbi:MAG: hypothetical protein ABUS57_05825 [Pseudomonadota bacterium]
MRVDSLPPPLPVAAEPKPKVEVQPGPGLSYTYVEHDADGKETWRFPNRPKDEVVAAGALLDLKV